MFPVIESQTRCSDHRELHAVYRQVDSKHKDTEITSHSTSTIDLTKHPLTHRSTTLAKKNKHVPISNIFITHPQVDPQFDLFQTGGVFYSYSFRSKGLILIQTRLYSIPRVHHSQESPMAKTKNKEKEELRRLDAECVGRFLVSIALPVDHGIGCSSGGTFIAADL